MELEKLMNRMNGTHRYVVLQTLREAASTAAASGRYVDAADLYVQLAKIDVAKQPEPPALPAPEPEPVQKKEVKPVPRAKIFELVDLSTEGIMKLREEFGDTSSKYETKAIDVIPQCNARPSERGYAYISDMLTIIVSPFMQIFYPTRWVADFEDPLTSVFELFTVQFMDSIPKGGDYYATSNMLSDHHLWLWKRKLGDDRLSWVRTGRYFTEIWKPMIEAGAVKRRTQRSCYCATPINEYLMMSADMRHVWAAYRRINPVEGGLHLKS